MSKTGEQQSVAFWQPQPIESIVAAQQTEPVSDIAVLKADFWPEDESADEFIEFIEQQRQEDLVSSYDIAPHVPPVLTA